MEAVAYDGVVFRIADKPACRCVVIFVGRREAVRFVHNPDCHYIVDGKAVGYGGILTKPADDTAATKRARYVAARNRVVYRGNGNKGIVGAKIAGNTACVKGHTRNDVNVYANVRVCDFRAEILTAARVQEGLLITDKPACVREIVVFARNTDLAVGCVAKEHICACAVADKRAYRKGFYRARHFRQACVDGEVIQLNTVEQAAAGYAGVGLDCAE